MPHVTIKLTQNTMRTEGGNTTCINKVKHALRFCDLNFILVYHVISSQMIIDSIVF